ncbi:MFS transporter [Neofamilia massiliensis]|uniref:MFS transporter n=1 Tax=Neofamilia massiliensis TaxID=1673724 RepID=UPI0006BB9532|nr:MFS transporter [Neofamilia massiliensis]
MRAYEVSYKKSIFSLIVIGLSYLLANFHRQSMAIMAPFLVESLNISNSQIGLLGAIVFYIYGLTQIPLGFLTSKYGGRKIIQVCLVLLIVGSFFFGRAKTFSELLLGRFLIGLAVSGYYVPGLHLIRQWFDVRSLSFYLGIYLAIGNVGSLLSTSPYEILLNNFSISSIYWGFIVFTFILLIASLFLEDEKISGKKVAVNNENEEKNPYFTWFFISLLFYGLTSYGARQAFFSLWGPLYYTDYLGLDLTRASFLMMVMSIGGIVYSPISGKVADKIGRHKALVIQSLLIALLWLLSAFLPKDTPFILVLLLALIIGALNITTISNAFTTLTDYAPVAFTSVFVGVFNAFNFFGSAFYMQGLGKFFDARGSSPETFSTALLIFFFSIVVAVFLNSFFYLKMAGHRKESLE